MWRILSQVFIAIGIALLTVLALIAFTWTYIFLIDIISWGILIAIPVLLCMAAIDFKRYCVKVWNEEKNKINY